MKQSNPVIVLMSTYNGSRFLREQIDSILNQDLNVHLCIRDDGSSDQTVEIIKKYVNSKKISLAQGENIGAKKSFMNLIFNAPEADYYALSDQDDIWNHDKLKVAVEKIQIVEKNNLGKPVPIMYHSTLELINEENKMIGMGGKYTNRGFLQGDTQSVTGCTMVFNRNMVNLLKKHMPESYRMHDVWIHSVCLAVGGIVIYDQTPHIKYRQHNGNVVGGRKDLASRIQRKVRYYKSIKDKQLSKMYKEILENYRAFMPEYNVQRCEKLCSYSDTWRNTINVLKDSEFFQGRFLWGLEKRILILLHKY